MKRLNNNNNKGKIHPSPDQFSLLPAAIITLAAALSPQDKEVLAYLISCSSSTSCTTPNNFSGKPKSTTKVSGGGSHSAEFTCDCFRCYMSYWVRWDASPNRQLIHEIIEAYEDGVFDKKVVKSKKDGRRKRVSDVAAAADDRGGSGKLGTAEMELNNEEGSIGYGELDCDQTSGTVRKLVSFMGERIWGVWGIV